MRRLTYIGILFSTLMWISGYEPQAILIIAPFFVIGIYLHLKNNSLDRIDLGIFMVLISAVYGYLYSGEGYKYYFIYVLSPIFYYYSTKIFHNNDEIWKVIKLFFAVFVFYAFQLFFRDVNGQLSFDFSQNVYYLTRNYVVYRSEIDDSIMNATNLSLLLLTIPLILITAREKLNIRPIISIVIIGTSIFTLFVVSSRMAIIALFVVVVNHYVLRKGVKKSRNIVLGTVFLFILFLVLINFEYTRTAINRFQELSFRAGRNEMYGLSGRQYYWAIAVIELSNNWLGYSHLYFLHKYEMSTHNEILGQLLAIGIFGTLAYYVIVFTMWLRIRRMPYHDDHFGILRSLGINLTIAYLIVGLTENITIANTFWLFFLFFVYGICNNNFKTLR